VTVDLSVASGPEGVTAADLATPESLFGANQGLAALREVLRRHSIRGTFAVPAVIAHIHRDLVRSLSAEGHEIAAHGFRHEDVSGLERDAEWQRILRTTEILADTVGRKPAGWFSLPRQGDHYAVGAVSPNTVDLLLEAGYVYLGNGLADDIPSVDDWIERNCGPDEDFMPALGRLRVRLIAGEVGVTGWLCTWDRYGRLMATDRVRQPIPPLAILDLTFDCRPPDWDIVLIPHNYWFIEDVSPPPPDTSGIKWYSDGVCWSEFDGWAELYLHKSGEMDLESETDQAFSSPKAIQHAPVHRTGLAGRPTSWHLVEAECRRRWQAGERYPGKVGESRSDWARSLVEWLKREHPSAPRPTEKTLKSKLAGLLRELARSDRPNS